MNLWVAFAKVEFKNPSIAILPPITLNMPKSDAPNALRTNRVLYKLTNKTIPILRYRYSVFLITLE